MLGEVNLTHTTSAEQALNNVASEDLTVVQRHVRKPTNDKANADKERGHQKAKDSEGMLTPITESMVPSALPDWSALSRSARRKAIKWMIGLGYNEDEARVLLNPPKYLLILPTLWPHRHVGFLQDLQYRRPAKRQLFCHLPTGLSGLIRLHHSSPQPGQ